MTLNLRSSVNWLLKLVAYLCLLNVLFLASNVSAQDSTAYYNVGSAGVWVESKTSDALPTESAPAAGVQYEDEYSYEADASAMPAYDSATANEEYDSSVIETSSEIYNDGYESETWTEEPAEVYAVVKNKDFFGVDKDDCCDEWSKFCKFKDMKFKCGCGGLKANKGHLGIRWLKSGDAGEDCNSCEGGCCKKGTAACRDPRQARRDVFSSAWKKGKRGRCEDGDEATCPEEEGCTSCR